MQKKGMRKKVCFALLAGVFCSGAMAQSVDYGTAKKIAENYCHQMKDGKNFTVSESYTQQHNGNTVYYIFNFKEGGFAVVSADEKVNPVIAYSTENTFDLQMKNPALKSWMLNYAAEIEEVMQSETKADAKIQRDWEDLKNGRPMFRQKADEAIEPLLTSTWNQDKYYNTNCPADDASEGEEAAGTAAYDNHVPVGCVALATSQIIYYHRYPSKGIGSSSYSSPYGKLTANYGKTNYNYNNMSDIAKGYSYDLAQLINHVGISVEMAYGPDGSSSQTSKAVNSLRKNFGYSSSIQLSERANYSSNESWHKLLLDNLKQGLPMIYGAGPAGGGAGHAFNCDGYDGNGKFHMNWGWAGKCNGYYDIDNMTKVDIHDLSSRHTIVCNIKPQNFTPKANDTLSGTYGSFGRGNMYNKYKAGEKLTWYICPSNAASITIDCSRFQTDTNDSVCIYSDPSKSKLLASYSGNNIKGKSLLINGGTAYITFTAQSDSKGGSGFVFNYTTTMNDLNYCNTTRLLSNTYRIDDISGKISNGSDGKTYADANECYWRIEPKNATAIWVSFDKFDLEEGDILYLYNYKAQNTINPSVINGLNNVVATYTKANPPELGKLIELEKNGLYLYFRTDNDKSGTGWSFNYGINVGVAACKAGIAAYNVFPNPATDQLNVRVTFEANEGRDAQIRMTDVLGRTVYRNVLQTSENDAELVISTSDLAAGMYILNIQTAKGSISKKVQIVK